MQSIFREEALRHRAGGAMQADVLRLSPSWTRWAYWCIVAAFAASILFTTMGTVHEYASGPAVVWKQGKVDVTATADGTVAVIDVESGQWVEAGTPLVRFHSALEQAELTRSEREFELQLAKALRDPADSNARQALTSLQTQRDLAHSRLDQLAVLAPHAGIVGDVRIRQGQRLLAGDVVLTLSDPDAEFLILAIVPAQFRPRLSPGMQIRFEVAGYRYAYQEMIVERVGAQVIGPREVQRYLGQEIADTIRIEGPVVLVEAKPKTTSFRFDDVVYDYHHGMNGIAEVQVRSESILVTLFPSLRSITTGARQ